MRSSALAAWLTKLDAIEAAIGRCATAEASRADVESLDLQAEIEELRRLMRADWLEAVREEARSV